jgi:hypothetical protein
MKNGKRGEKKEKIIKKEDWVIKAKLELVIVHTPP